MEPLQRPDEKEPQLQGQRNFVVPGADVIIQCGDEPMAIADLLSLIFQIAGSNPETQVDFWIKVKG